MWQEGKIFFNSEVIYILGQTPQNVIQGGDFNFVVRPSDSTYIFNQAELLNIGNTV